MYNWEAVRYKKNFFLSLSHFERLKMNAYYNDVNEMQVVSKGNKSIAVNHVVNSELIELDAF